MTGAAAPLDLAVAVGRLKLKLPTGYRLLQVGDDAIPTGQADGLPLHYVSLYAHIFGLSLVEAGGRLFIISNGFLASHAYNLALVMLHHGARGEAALLTALRHNFKKIYAECALYRGNCLIGRALLIETIAYEQDVMRPLFAAAASDPALGARARIISNVMAAIVGGHELGHYFERLDPAGWLDELAMLGDGSLARLVVQRQQSVAGKLAIETACDGVGAWSVWRADSDYAEAVPDQIDRLRLCAFAFLCFGELFSLQRSAWFAADQAKTEDQAIALGSERRTALQFSLPRGRDAAMDDRVGAMLGYFEAEAAKLGGALYGDDGFFPLRRGDAGVLRQAFETFDALAEDDPPGLGGTDLHRRGLAQMMGEALHGHPGGATHLLWRSKRFLQGGQDIDP